jgi:hypothetical protein
MPLFTGDYIQEAVDFKIVTTEPELIAAFDDPENPTVPGDIETFADLAVADPVVHANVIETANEIIRDAEEMVEAYARPQGYKIPLSLGGQPDSIAKSIAVRLAWISARQRRHIITSEQAELERDRLQRNELRDIARGVLVLTAERDTDTPALASNVYAVTSEERMFSRGRLSGL